MTAVAPTQENSIDLFDTRILTQDVRYETNLSTVNTNFQSSILEEMFVSSDETETDTETKTDTENDRPKVTELQDELSVQGMLSQFSTFAGYEITGIYGGEKIKIGTRVLSRINLMFRDNKNDNDLGTIINVSSSGNEVLVQWDHDHQSEFCRTGRSNEFELLLFDNAQSGVKHSESTCNACNEDPLRGIRWKCLKCDNYNLCTNCYMGNEHEVRHAFERIESEDSKGEEIPPRSDNKLTHCSYACGILKGADVTLRGYNGLPKDVIGNVVEIHDLERNTFRSVAKVEWKHTYGTQLYVVEEDIWELTWFEKFTGPQYYEDHLPIVTKDNAKKGTRVIRTYESGDERGGYVGTIVSVLPEKTVFVESCICVQWDDGNIDQYKFDGMDLEKKLKIFDNGPAGIDHSCLCMECNHAVRGIRWKCTTCKRKKKNSLCTICYMSDKHDKDNHKFLTLVDTPENT